MYNHYNHLLYYSFNHLFTACGCYNNSGFMPRLLECSFGECSSNFSQVSVLILQGVQKDY